MSLIDSISLKNNQGIQVEYDIGLNANNISYDNENSVKDKIDNNEGHKEAPVANENGPHGIRYYQDKLQIWDNAKQEWISISDSGSGDVNIGDVSGAEVAVNKTTATLTWSDPNDIIIDGIVLARWAGTTVVRKAGSAPTDVSDGTVVVTNTTRNQYSVTGYQDIGLSYDTTYYYRFFPYKMNGPVKVYTDGTSVTATPARTVIANIPSPVSTLTYNGSSQSPTWNNYNSDELTLTGDTSGINAGTYAAIFTPKDGYCWSDSSLTGKTVNWSIVAASITPPTVTGTSLTYNRAAQGPTISSYDTNLIDKSGYSATNAGNYTLTLSLIDNSNYQWSDGTITDKTYPWSIVAKNVTVPSLSGTYTYTGSSQNVTISNYDSNEITVSGESSAINAGNHTVYFNLTSITNYIWSDGTTAQKSATWNIAKAAGGVTLTYNGSPVTSSTNIEFDDSTDTATVTISNATGTVTASSSVAGVATTSIGGSTLTIACGGTSGESTITVNVAVSANYNAYSISFKATASLIALVSWSSGTDEQIQAIVNGYYNGNITLAQIQSVWKIGDVRNITIDAIPAKTTGSTTQQISESHRSQVLEMQIIDFNHDDLTNSINGKTKALLTIDTKKCLRDADVDNYTSTANNTEIGYMVPNSGILASWDGCARRTWCNDQFYNALPSIFKGMIKQVKKETYNLKGGSDNPHMELIITNDYIWFPSVWEVFGNTTSGYPSWGSVYGQEGIQYDFYNTLLNRWKKPSIGSSGTNSSTYWLRSCSSATVGNDRYRFCRLNGSAENYICEYGYNKEFIMIACCI